MAAFGELALHTWVVDTTPLAGALAAACSAGFNAVELRVKRRSGCREGELRCTSSWSW